MLIVGDAEFWASPAGVWKVEGSAVRGDQPKAVPKGLRQMLGEPLDHDTVEFGEGRSQHLVACLRESTTAGELPLITGKLGQEGVEKALEIALEGSKEEADDDRKGKAAIAGEVDGLGSVSRDEVGIVNLTAN